MEEIDLACSKAFTVSVQYDITTGHFGIRIMKFFHPVKSVLIFLEYFFFIQRILNCY